MFRMQIKLNSRTRGLTAKRTILEVYIGNFLCSISNVNNMGCSLPFACLVGTINIARGYCEITSLSLACKKIQGMRCKQKEYISK